MGFFKEMLTDEQAGDMIKSLKVCSESASEARDCAVRALAAVSGIDYAEVNRWLIEGGYRKPRGGTYYHPYELFLREHGIQSREIRVNEKTIRSFQKRKYQGKFLVLVRGHILAVIDGQAIDWAANRLHRIRCVIQVLED